MPAANRLALLAFSLMALAIDAAASPIDVSALKPFPCPDDEGYVDRSIIRHCGHLRISDGPNTKAIDLAVVVLIPPGETRAKRTPTVFVHGGPGFGVVDAWWSIAMLRFADAAPLVIFDQRSVGQSGPKLCEFLDVDDPALDELPPQQLRERALQDAKRCTTALSESSIDLAAYGTLGTVRDMEKLREALHIEKWNVYGISYGTTVTLAYLAAHPDRVRAAVLDSVYPPEMRGFSTMLPDFVSAFDVLNRTCMAQPRCRNRFGDVRAALDAALIELEKHPLPVRVTDPDDDTETDRHLSGSTLLGLVQSKMLQTDGWPVIPLLIANARERNASALIANAFKDGLYEASFAASGAYMATECRERAPFDDGSDLGRQAAAWPTVARVASVETLLDTCSNWPAKQTRNWTTPTNVVPPTLVVGGEWDPVTPPAHARRTAAALGAHAQLLIVPKAAHSVTTMDDCTQSIVADFFAAPDSKLNVACVSRRTEPLFATRLIEVDHNAAVDPGYLPASSWIVLSGLLSAFIWPAAWLLTTATQHPWPDRPAVQRSAFWLSLTTIGLIAWAVQPFRTVVTSPDVTWAWTTDGIPAESWLAFPLIVVLAATTLAGAVALQREWREATLGTWQLLHRTFVVVSLILVFASVWRLGLLAQAPSHVLDEARQLLTAATGVR